MARPWRFVRSSGSLDVDRGQSVQQRVNGWQEDELSSWRPEELVEGVPEEIIDLLPRWPKATAKDWACAEDYTRIRWRSS